MKLGDFAVAAAIYGIVLSRVAEIDFRAEVWQHGVIPQQPFTDIRGAPGLGFPARQPVNSGGGHPVDTRLGSLTFPV